MAGGGHPSLARSRAIVAEWLRSREDEIREAVCDRLEALPGPKPSAGSLYADGIRRTVAVAIDYGVLALETRQRQIPPVPGELLSQARLAAQEGISLRDVIRRYLAGYSLLIDYLLSAGQEPLAASGADLQSLLRVEVTLLDRVVAAVSHEYESEASRRALTSDERRLAWTRRLLDGEVLDTSDFGYEFDGWHVGLVASGAGAEKLLTRLDAELDARLLRLRPSEHRIWAWFGTRRRLEATQVRDAIGEGPDFKATVAIGEPAKDLGGWRLSHRQAAAALPLARLYPMNLVRYADVATLASARTDNLLATSLRRLYLEPLRGDRDGGATYGETLRAYLDSDRNTSSTAAALRVSRATVANRLRRIEALIGRDLKGCTTDIDIALKLESIEEHGQPPVVSA